VAKKLVLNVLLDLYKTVLKREGHFVLLQYGSTQLLNENWTTFYHNIVDVPTPKKLP